MEYFLLPYLTEQLGLPLVKIREMLKLLAVPGLAGDGNQAWLAGKKTVGDFPNSKSKIYGESMGKYSEKWGIAMIFLAIFQPHLMKPEDNVHYPVRPSFGSLNSMVSAKDALKLVH